MKHWHGIRLLVVTLIACSGAAFAQEILIFGGPQQDEFLGCFSCSEYDSDSVFNEYGTYGSEYSRTSIFNEYGDYGSPYSDESVCNPYADDPPVLVDSTGGFYGRLTVNRYHRQAITDDEIVQWLEEVVCD